SKSVNKIILGLDHLVVELFIAKQPFFKSIAIRFRHTSKKVIADLFVASFGGHLSPPRLIVSMPAIFVSFATQLFIQASSLSRSRQARTRSAVAVRPSFSASKRRASLFLCCRVVS